MHRYLRLFVLTTMALGATASNAQTPPPAIEGPVYVATYVELLPTTVKDGSALLKQYRDATRKDAGNQRAEVVQETNRPTRLVVLTIWGDQKAFEAHGKAAHTAQFRDKLKGVHAAPYDERVHSGMAVGAKDALRAGSVVVVTHVDVPPPFKDTTVPMLQQLAEASRKDAGNQRFEAQQQANRPNHFTVVEAWADRKTYEGHVLAAHTRQFRDKLGPMSGALYDERLFTVVD
ncbi:MAG TPA: antibiotic biosynthesis monooxygenase [Burkholderiales bacterium]|jgi:quinol monooxygenase YgiN|nr:antibiotic biosynthesis monooxygenase [Burkholderiales bacterium]